MSCNSLGAKIKYLKESRLNTEEIRRRVRLRAPMFEFVMAQIERSRVNFGSIPTINDIAKEAKRISTIRPGSNTLIDQCPIGDLDLARRVGLVLDYEFPIEAKSGLFVGDDDLASALILKVSNPHKIALVDIDRRVLQTVKSVSNGKGASFYCANILDIVDGIKRDPIGNSLFDFFVTDPPYTEAGYMYFLTYGLKHLKLNGRAFIAIPYMNLEEWSQDLLYKVEQFLIRAGCVVEEIIPGFAVYQHSDGVVSSLIVARKVSKTSSDVENKFKRERVYTTGYRFD